MALRCAAVMRGISNPFEVLTISSNAEALGVIVPMPALPMPGKMFWATALSAVQIKSSMNAIRIFVPIVFIYLVLKQNF